MHLENIPQERNKEDKPPLKSKVVVPHRSKGPPYEKFRKEKLPTQAHQASNKRPSQDKSSSNQGDCSWKKVKPY